MVMIDGLGGLAPSIASPPSAHDRTKSNHTYDFRRHEVFLSLVGLKSFYQADISNSEIRWTHVVYVNVMLVCSRKHFRLQNGIFDAL